MAITASIIGATFITVMMDGTTHTINGDHSNYAAIRDALRNKDHALVERLINVKKSVVSFGQGKVTVSGGSVYYDGKEVRGSVVVRILQMIREGFDAQPMMNFLENLMQNPSKRAVDELYGFLEATSLPITEDGCFLSYKKVRHDWKDFYTGTITHKLVHLMTADELAELPGTFGDVTVSVENGVTVLSMPRNQVDDDKDQTCSYGLHFCSLGYLPHYHGGDGRVVIVKINPRDVVSIPSDYNNAKGRACRYEVVGEHTSEDRERTEYFNAPVYTANADRVAPAAPVKTGPSAILERIRDAGSPPAAPGAETAAPQSPKVSPALTGYNMGRSDASNRRPFDDRDARFSGPAADSYASAYAKGYSSLQAPAVGTEPETDTAMDDNDDWYDQAYGKACNDVKTRQPYNDEAPTGCDDDHRSSYIEGYADGWRDTKVMQI